MCAAAVAASNKTAHSAGSILENRTKNVPDRVIIVILLTKSIVPKRHSGWGIHPSLISACLLGCARLFRLVFDGLHDSLCVSSHAGNRV
jgi:hypothetical protein